MTSQTLSASSSDAPTSSPSTLLAKPGIFPTSVESVRQGGEDIFLLLDQFLDKIICGDNCETLAAMPAESVDLVVTSPPYDDLRTYGGHSWDFYGVAWLLKRVLKPGGVIVWNVADATVDGGETGTSMRQGLHFQTLGLRLHDTMIYEKNNFANPADGRYHQTWEYCFVLSKGKPKAWNPIKDKRNAYPGQRSHGKNRTKDGWKENTNGVSGEWGQRHNVWKYTTGGGHMSDDSLTHEHPAAFPDALARDHIQSWSNPGDVVLDPFAGSGTTLKAAKEIGRRFVGIEINPAYVDICKRRIAQNVFNF